MTNASPRRTGRDNRQKGKMPRRSKHAVWCIGLTGRQYILPSQRPAVLRRYEIAFGDSPEERDVISAPLWRALGILIAHEAMWGRDRPGVRVRPSKAGRSAVPFAQEVELSRDDDPFAITAMLARQLCERWGLATIVGVSDGNGGHRYFFAPTELARLALQHTPSLVSLVRDCVADMQRSAA